MATNTAGTAGTAGGTPSSAGGQVTVQNAEALVDELFLIGFASVGDSMLGRSGTGGEFSTLVNAPPGNSYTVNCDAGGSYSVTKTRNTPAGNSVGDTATITLNQCKTVDSGITLTENGKVIVKLTKVSGGYIVGADSGSLGFDMSFENLSVNHAGGNSSGQLTMNGTWSGSVDEDVVSGRVTLAAQTFSITGTENGKSYQATVREFSETYTLNKPTQAYTMDVDFKLDLASIPGAVVSGTYTVVTEPVFRGIADDFGHLDPSPTSGKLTVTGANGGRLVLEARPGGAWLSVDENGDGVADKETLLNWSQIAR